MKTIRFTLIIGILFSFTSLTTYRSTKHALIGTWIYSDYDDQAMHYEKARSFDENQPGIEFKRNGKLVKRQNEGWCGTPPITYKNFNGSWKQTSDSTLEIHYAYWGGTIEEDWLIVRIENTKLTVKRLEYSVK